LARTELGKRITKVVDIAEQMAVNAKKLVDALRDVQQEVKKDEPPEEEP